ncbi:hypothetical protein F5Y06DRAFT_255727 [Hypoxylon sp. FL0890]|nr:hypothetical protein F5Y06DRAFT_255727 [Hypoxylon sp. FL0890]
MLNTRKQVITCDIPCDIRYATMPTSTAIAFEGVRRGKSVARVARVAHIMTPQVMPPQ